MKKFILLSIILVITIGCATKDPVQPVVEKGWPLKTGTLWEYDYVARLSDLQGNVLDSMRLSMYFKISDQTTFDEETWSIIDVIINEDSAGITVDSDTAQWYWAEREDGLYARESDGTLLGRILRYPMEQYDIFHPDDEWFFIDDIDYEVAGVNVPVEVPAGRFNCYIMMGRIDYTDWYRNITISFNPDFGLTKVTYRDLYIDGAMLLDFSLVRFVRGTG